MSKISLTIDELKDFEHGTGEHPMMQVIYNLKDTSVIYSLIGYYLGYDNGDEGKIPEGYERNYEGKPELPFMILTDILGWNSVPDRYKSHINYVHLGHIERIKILVPERL